LDAYPDNGELLLPLLPGPNDIRDDLAFHARPSAGNSKLVACSPTAICTPEWWCFFVFVG
jgi:hypothetical protein